MATKAGLEQVAAWAAAALDHPNTHLGNGRIAIALYDIAYAEGFDTVEAFLWRLTQEDSLLLNLNDYVGGGAIRQRQTVNGITFAVTVQCETMANGEETPDVPNG